MKNTPRKKLNFTLTERRWFRAAGLFFAVIAATAGSLLASSDDAWEEFRQDVSTKMERAIAGTFASHSIFVEPFGSESYGLAIASGVSAGEKRPLTVFGIYTKKTKTLEIIEVPETLFEKKAAGASGQSPAATAGKGTDKSIAALLQGKWRHADDSKNLVVFDRNVRKESSDGGKTWDKTTFVLEDRCKNPGNAGHPQEASDERYISTADDLCWHVDLVTGTELSLTYVGRGNTLNYQRVTK